MKLVKKLLIPGVALIVLFGFSFSENFSFTHDQQYFGNFGSFSNYHLYSLTGTSGQQIISYSVFIPNGYDLTNGIWSGFDIGKYTILNFPVRTSKVCYISLYSSGIEFKGYSWQCRIINNKLYSYNSNTTGIIINGYCNNTSSNFCYLDKDLIIGIDFIGVASIDYKNSIYINESGSFLLNQSTINGVGSSTKDGFSNLLHFIIQFLPLMIFVFIIGYIIRKILIRFGMLKSPGVALDSKTYNKGRK